MVVKNANSPLILNYIYLYHTDEWLLLPEYPDSVMDKMGSTFQQTNALSRTAPVFTYSYSGPRDVQIQLHLQRDLLDDINLNASNMTLDVDEDYVEVLIRKLQAVALPRYEAASKSVVPPMVAVRLGKDIFIKGVVVGGVSIEYQKPILDDDRYSQVVLSFVVYEVEPYDAVSVGKEGSFRGITRPFRDESNVLENITNTARNSIIS